MDFYMIYVGIIVVLLIGFNLANSQFDAYRIMAKKTIAHGINFGVYTAFSILIWWLMIHDWRWEHLLLFAVMTFTCRQISFDIPLNWRRHLHWDYVSPATPPKAIMDRIEQFVFGKNGKLPVYIYAGTWILSLALLLWVSYK